ncbi:hypothetical protein [Xanthomonas phaseoli]|uniref:hypothetical protein n=1 Tax=Xanthomonas phaseoli TaxID=1985254 RepID=UPI001ED97567|nr:hypothetical protein [Xanthomonas phaseoli]
MKDEPSCVPIQSMPSGYYWFLDNCGSPPEIVEVDVEEGFVHLIARDSPLYFPAARPTALHSVPTSGRWHIKTPCQTPA